MAMHRISIHGASESQPLIHPVGAVPPNKR